MPNEGPDDADADLMEEANIGTRCPNCREVIWDEAEQCPRCRHWITPSDRDRNHSAGGGRWRFVLVLVVILLILALAMM